MGTSIRPLLACLLIGCPSFLLLYRPAQAGYGGMTVTPSAGTPSPYPAWVGQEITTSLTGTYSDPPTSDPYSGCTLSGPNFTWFFKRYAAVEHSPDGINWRVPEWDWDFSVTICQPSDTSPDAYMHATFDYFGYWRVPVMLQVWYDDGVCENWFRADGWTTVEMVADTVQIKRKITGAEEYWEISAAEKDGHALPGQRIDLEATITPVPMANPTYLWTLPGKVFKNYAASDEAGVLTPVGPGDKAGRTIQFYWVSTGQLSPQCTVTANGKDKTGSATINVHEPPLEVFQVTYLRDVKLGKPPNPNFGLGAPVRGQQGIGFEANIGSIKSLSLMPLVFGSEGKFQYVQLINTATNYTLKNGDRYRRRTSKLWVLDTEYPYGGITYNTGEEKAKQTSDTPGIDLGGLDATVVKHVEEAAEFEMYLMFRPPGPETETKWVPIAYIEWSFAGAVTSGMNGGWVYNQKGTRSAGDAILTVTHPQWTDNFDTPRFFIKDRN